ncbi:S8 family serine peptidase [Brevibacillus invocatus]|uniref:S8 family serine peptidase n=1 Tax=Brevibacillus invocatus TaxID=173959 RepID=UPI00203A4AB7|nr:S8 family serine peptidase [Brevibacillus invocatus]MCM3079638.1 S8 family serine peptidase [Brevibacillus invocatus]MCM3431152.1 S8 family serine peptidase [Brevibacillus invocatus]
MKRWVGAMLAVIVGVVMVMADIQPVAAATDTNDPYFGNQIHLSQIKATKAWDTVKSNTSITIAVLDTGADYRHPDLKDNLLPGINLVNPGKSAQDDNGHGTEVTGVLAAEGNNGIGVSGVLWKARILPIKVLDKNAVADLDLVAKGIHAALDRGAKVILMSVSSMSYSPALTNAVNRAEANGAVLVAASGNEGDRVAYPAAYPTVIAVGGVKANNEPIIESNSGPELNLMATGLNVYTTKLGGKYGGFSGTSAAAPQVAGAAALVLERHPKLRPIDVRQLLYQTATDLGTPGWDKRTGYGLLDIQKAVRSPMSMDFLEPNNTQSQTKAFPIESQIRGNLGPNDTVDWYWMDIPYDGKVTFKANVSVGLASPMAATFYSDKRSPVTHYIGNGDTLTVPVKAGRMSIKLVRNGGVSAFTYVLTSKFSINPDRYEPNNTMETARPLVGNQISVTGNFHEERDQDWFSYYVREYGSMDVTVTPDTKRMDLVLNIGKQEGTQTKWDPAYDSGDRDDPTERVQKEVSPGKYFIRVSEYEQNAVNAEYTLDLNFTPVKKDPNEPNDTYRQASPLEGGYLMTGTFPTATDTDWFQFTVNKESYVSIRAPFVPVPSGMRIALYSNSNLDYAIATTNMVAQLSDQGKEVLGVRLQPGKYYIRLNSATSFKYDLYRLTVNQQELIAGYRDISTHWARNEIVRLSSKGVVKGFDDATFKPDQAVTRAQFATMLIQAMKANRMQVGTYSGKTTFTDLSRNHWAYNNLGLAYQLGIIKGYPNRQMKPDQAISRAEMAAMVARAHNVLWYPRSVSSYRDVPTSHWASPAIEALTTREWLRGYGSLFKPTGIATRAEVVVLISKSYKL